MALTKKQKRFVSEYLIDLHGTNAAIRAGYSPRRAAATASEFLANRKISEEVARQMATREKRTHITQDRVLQELSRIAFFDIRRLYGEDGALKRPHELDDDAAAVLSGVDVVEEFSHESGRKQLVGHTKKAKVFDKGAALALAMRHLGMLTDKTELTGRDGQPIKSESLVRVYIPANGRD